ncbi:hypothetical protein D555_4043 [Bordetella holmesii 35009]|nr:hypothetical protein D555_4043 [Bordetella holmesii 35009]
MALRDQRQGSGLAVLRAGRHGGGKQQGQAGGARQTAAAAAQRGSSKEHRNQAAVGTALR